MESLSTAIVMGEVNTVNQILDHIGNVDFNTTTKPNDRISLFESTVRYLRGLISGMSART